MIPVLTQITDVGIFQQKYYGIFFLTTEWNENSEANFNDLWPNWNKTIKSKHPEIDSVGKLSFKSSV